MPYNLKDAGSTDPSHLAPDMNALVAENKQLRLTIDGLIDVARSTWEWTGHGIDCTAREHGLGCNCAHNELHAAVQAAEEATK